MNEPLQPPSSVSPLVPVPAGEDRFGELRSLGFLTLDFKVTAQDSSDIFVIEFTAHRKGGPARHIHYEQDEWFYCIEGEFILEVGQERITLKPGDSLLAPRNVPHGWASVGDAQGRMLVVLTPPSKIEAFFLEATGAYNLPPQDPEIFHVHGMEWIGPPLSIE